MKDIGAFKAVLGSDNDGIADMERLLSLSETYGYRDWLVFDAAVVRGLSYYTGIVFEAVDRKVGLIITSSMLCGLLPPLAL